MTFTSSTFGQSNSPNPEKVPLTKVINSAYIETRPLISADGTTLYFSRKHHPENINGEKDSQDIWVSHLLENGEWSPPENLGKPLNNKDINAVVSINRTGEEGIFVNSYEKLSKQATNVLAKSHKTDEGWTAPEALTIKNFSNKSIYADFYFSYEENVLLLAIQKVDDKALVGDQDLYVSFSTLDGNWGEPINLGKAVNTSRAEYAPFLGSDGKSLFFVSEGHSGEGGSDIFYTERLDDSWTQWSEPENLGSTINSKDEETYFSITSDFEKIYFESYKKRALNRNIFMAGLPERFKPTEDEAPAIAFAPAEKATTEPIASGEEIMTRKDEPAPNETAESPVNTTPSFSTTRLSAPQKETKATSSVGNKILTEFEKVHIANGGNAVAYMLVENIYFDFNQAQIKEEYQAKLDKIGEILAEEPGLSLEIAGFADGLGGEGINKEISEHRAKSVADYLIRQGNISPNQIVMHAFGEKYPIASNDDENEGRELNRRVELKFVQSLQ